MKIRIKAAAAVAVVAALAMGTVTSTASQAAGSTLTLGTFADITSFAVSKAEFGNRVLAYQAVYDTLLRQTTAGKLVPGLATAWKYNTSQTKLTLTLRSGVKFSNGHAFTPSVVIKNLKNFKAGTAPAASYLANYKSAVVKGTNQVVITLSDVDPAFLDYLARESGLMEDPAMFGKSNEATTPVGTGPYVLNKLKTRIGSTYVFNSNPTYWDKANRRYDNFTLKYISDPTAGVNALKAGQIQGYNLISNDPLPELRRVSGMKFASQTNDWVGLSFVDRSGDLNSPIRKLKVRQAMNYAFNRTAMLNAIGQGYGTVVQQVFSPKSAGYNKSLNSTYPYNPTKARQLLSEAGYPDGFTLKMPAVSAVLGEATYAIIESQLAAVGITVDREEVALGNFFGDILTPKYPSYLMFLEQSPNDWQFINFLLSDTAVWNPEHFSDSTSAKLIGRIQSATAAGRPALLKQLNKYVVDQAWFSPWFVKQGNFAYKGIKVTPQKGNAVPYLYNIK